jgi:hypothetical protein
MATPTHDGRASSHCEETRGCPDLRARRDGTRRERAAVRRPAVDLQACDASVCGPRAGVTQLQAGRAPVPIVVGSQVPVLIDRQVLLHVLIVDRHLHGTPRLQAGSDDAPPATGPTIADVVMGVAARTVDVVQGLQRGGARHLRDLDGQRRGAELARGRCRLGGGAAREAAVAQAFCRVASALSSWTTNSSPGWERCLSEPGPLSRSGVSGCGVLRSWWVRSFRGRPGLSGSAAWWPAT